MSEHVIQNPVPTPEQMAEMLGVSPERVTTLRGIMKAPSPGSFDRRRRASGVTSTGTTSLHRKAMVLGKGKDSTRAKSKAR